MQHTIFYYNYHLYIYNYNICIKLTQLGSSKLGFNSELEKEGCASIALLKLVGVACSDGRLPITWYRYHPIPGPNRK